MRTSLKKKKSKGPKNGRCFSLLSRENVWTDKEERRLGFQIFLLAVFTLGGRVGWTISERTRTPIPVQTLPIQCAASEKVMAKRPRQFPLGLQRAQVARESIRQRSKCP